MQFQQKIKDKISPYYLEKIKNELFEYLGIKSAEIDIFMEEFIIENKNYKKNIDEPKLIDD